MRGGSALGLAFLLLAACAEMEPFDPPVAGELNPEPGLFSGPIGEFVIGTRAWPLADDDEAAVPPAPPPRRRLTDPPPP